MKKLAKIILREFSNKGLLMETREINKILFVTKKLTILIAEDDKETAELYRKTFKPFFKDVKVANDGMEAYDIFCKSPIDILVTDIVMPKVNGIELISKIKLTRPSMPIIVVSAFTEQKNFIEFIKAGVEAFLPKPLSVETLFHCAYSVAVKVDEQRLVEEYIGKLEDQALRYMGLIDTLRAQIKQMQTEPPKVNTKFHRTAKQISSEHKAAENDYFKKIDENDKHLLGESIKNLINHLALVSKQNATSDKARLSYSVDELKIIKTILQKYSEFASIGKELDTVCMLYVADYDRISTKQHILEELGVKLHKLYEDAIQTKAKEPNMYDKAIHDCISKITNTSESKNISTPNKNTTSAKEYLSDVGLDINSLDEMKESEADAMYVMLNHNGILTESDKSKLVKAINKYSSVLLNLIEFEKIGYSFKRLGNIIQITNLDALTESNRRKLPAFCKSTIEDLQAWRIAVFEDASATDIHWLDDSFKANIAQLEMLLCKELNDTSDLEMF